MTMLMAATGITTAAALRPDVVSFAPTMTPTRLVKLYSIAGARLQVWPGPEFSSTAAGDNAVPAGPYGSSPDTCVFESCSYTTSSARTQLRVRLYSHAALMTAESPGRARPLKPSPVPYTLTSRTLADPE